MASLSRAELVDIWKNAHYIYLQSRLADVRRSARRIAKAIETVIGQQSPTAENWEV